MIVAVRLAWAAVTIAAIAAVALGWLMPFDAAAQAEYAAALDGLRTLDAGLDIYTLKARAGMTTSYEPFVRMLADARTTRSWLRGHVPSFVSDGEKSELLGKLDEAGAAFDEKAAVIEQLKTDNAVLRNSLRYFPKLAAELVRAARVDAAWVELMSAVLLLSTLPDAELRTRADQALENGEALASRTGDDDLRVLLDHARRIQERKPLVDALGNAVLTIDTRGRINGLDDAFERASSAAIDRAARHRLWVFALVLAAVGLGAFDFIGRLRSLGAELRSTNDRLRKREREARAREREARELSRLKSNFASMTAHEFRTPLTVILSSTDMLDAHGERWPRERLEAHYGQIRAAVGNMTKTLEGILLIGRAEAGMVKRSPHAMKLDSYLADLAHSAQLAAQGEDPRVDVAIHGPTHVFLDEKLVSHSLGNLLSNALKYSPPQTRVGLTATVDADRVRFEIVDRGIGISEEDQRQLFSPFMRGKNVGIVAGTGLGLAVVKAALDVLQAEIRIESRVDEGTRVIVSIPLNMDEGGSET